jgi:perosamine synthetase
MIPHSRPCLGKEELRAAARVIKSGRLACGEETRLFEQEMSRWTGIRHAVAVLNGSHAIELVLRVWGLGPKDEVIIPSYCCSALWHAACRAGATPVLADCDLDTLNPSPADVARRLTRKTKAVILPNLFGLPCDPADYRLPKGVRVLQDCAQALGAKLGSRSVGATGDACILSFYATKLMACGEGGMALSDSKALVEAVRDLRGYDNMVPDKVRDNAKPGEIESAIGREQLKKLGAFIARRAALARTYDRLLSGTDLVLPLRRPGRVYYRYVVRLRKPVVDAVLARLDRRGIMARKPVFRPLHIDVPCRGRFPNSELAHACCLSLPLHPLISQRDAARVASALKSVLML